MTISWESYNEIHNVLVAVHTHFNMGEFDEMGRIFEHATLTTAYTWADQAIVVGGERIGEGYRRATRLHNGLPRVQYWLSNVVIDGDDANGVAKAESQYAALVGDESTWSGPHGMEAEDHAKPPIQIFSVGRYHDDFERIDGAWRITNRMIYADLTGDRSLHLKTDPLKDRAVGTYAEKPAGYS
jgi:hypothetical protein